MDIAYWLLVIGDSIELFAIGHGGANAVSSTRGWQRL
jgi:hypothetical protein